MSDLNLDDVDFYEALGVDPECTTEDIKNAYYRLVFEWYEDETSTNLEAVNKFYRLSKIVEILKDKNMRKAYDKKRNAKFEEWKLQQLHAFFSAEAVVFDRLLKQLEKLVQMSKSSLRNVEEIEVQVNVLYRILITHGRTEELANRLIKIKWKIGNDDETNGGYSKEILREIFTKYGEINNFIYSKDLKGKAIVEFKTDEAAGQAMDCEKGLPENPLTLVWI